MLADGRHFDAEELHLRRSKPMLAFAIGLVAISMAGAVAAQPLLPLRERLAGLQVAAHRGGSGGGAAENTIERFEAARSQGADVIETDLRLSRDGVVFLFHDRTLGHHTACRGEFSEHSADEIRACTLYGSDHGPQTFEEALAWSAGRVVFDAEFKTFDVIRPAIALVKAHDAYEWVFFQVGAGVAYYYEARAADPNVALLAGPQGPAAIAMLDELLAADDDRLLVIELHPKLLDRDGDLIDRIRRLGKLTSIDAWYLGGERTRGIWPVGRKAACTAAFERGITIVVTKVPEECVRQRETFVLLHPESSADAGRMHYSMGPEARGATR
jgi:hypothetical protein